MSPVDAVHEETVAFATHVGPTALYGEQGSLCDTALPFTNPNTLFLQAQQLALDVLQPTKDVDLVGNWTSVFQAVLSGKAEQDGALDADVIAHLKAMATSLAITTPDIFGESCFELDLVLRQGVFTFD